MPTPTLSLVGFMDQAEALIYLGQGCIPPNPDAAAILADWQTARAKLGNPTPNAGHPTIMPIPPGNDAYLQQMQNQPWLAPFLPQLGAWEIKLVEIDPLLAFQFHVSLERAAVHVAGLSSP